ncbi:Swi5 domain containing protein [Lactarius tabidus]
MLMWYVAEGIRVNISKRVSYMQHKSQSRRPGENAQQIVARHIKLLHHYNEAKDAAQIIIGKLAAHRQTTIRQIHEDYGLIGDD